MCIKGGVEQVRRRHNVSCLLVTIVAGCVVGTLIVVPIDQGERSSVKTNWLPGPRWTLTQVLSLISVLFRSDRHSANELPGGVRDLLTMLLCTRP